MTDESEPEVIKLHKGDVLVNEIDVAVLFCGHYILNEATVHTCSEG